MDKLREIEKRMDDLESEIERIKAFGEYLQTTTDYTMTLPEDKEAYDVFMRRGQTIEIDAMLIGKHLLEYVEQLHDKWLELHRELDGIELKED